ncbi:MAG: YjcQ family protein [Clostridiales bacterium]|nr:YjcQ family protein [Clostridiales bacterium]
MENFRAIHKILSAFEEALKTSGGASVQPETIGVSEAHLGNLLEMLDDGGLIKGIVAARAVGGASISARNAKITLAGLEYLADSKHMRQISQG